MTDGASDHPSYRPDIDGLRAVAVLSVLVFHAFPAVMRGGFVGVDIFFVISGFLISTILLKGLERGHFSLAEFYARRIRRIFPALAIVLAACLAFGWIGLFATEFEQVGKHVAGGAGFVSNLLLFGESGYFDGSAETKPLLHLWSLGIEEQFYIVWPLLLYGLWKLRLNVLAAIGVLGLASFAWSLKTTTFDSSAAFFLPQSRAWELLIGSGLSALTLRRCPIAAPRVAHALSCAGAVLVALACWVVHSKRAFPGWWALLPTVGAAFIVAAGPNAVFNKRVLALKPLVLIGLISYPLYLWHWPLLSFARIVASKVPAASTRGLLLAVTFLLASATYFFVERPLRRGKAPRAKVFVLAATVALVGGAGYAVMAHAGMPERPVAQSGATFFAELGSSQWPFSRNRICEKRYPFPRLYKLGWWFCIQSRNRAPSVILLGDSFTNHLYPGLVSQPQLRRHTVLSIGTCALTVGRPGDPLTPQTRHPCSGDSPRRQREFIDRLIERTPSIRYAISSGLLWDADEDYAKRLEERIASLEARGIQVILFVPHVPADMDLSGCIPRPFRTEVAGCQVGAQPRRAINMRFGPLAERLIKSSKRLKVFDQNEAYCDSEHCSFIVDGKPMFRDGFHFSVAGSTLVADKFVDWARHNLPEVLR